MLGVKFSAKGDELAVKAGVFFTSKSSDFTKVTPILSTISAGQLLHFNGGKYLDTEGVIFHYQDAVFEVLKHIDRPVWQKIALDNKITEAELVLKLGLRTNLVSAYDNTKAAIEEDKNSTEGAINTAFASYKAFVSWTKALLMPIQGGLWIEGELIHNKLNIKSAIPIASKFISSSFTTHKGESIEFDSTQMQGKGWYVEAKDVLITTSFSSFERKSKSGSVHLAITIAGNMNPDLSVSAGTSSQSESRHYHSHIMMDQEVVMDLSGTLSIEGGSIEAGSLRLNVNKLLLKSVQNLASNKSSGFSLSLDVSDKASSFLTGGGASFGRGDRKWIDELSVLIGRDNVEIIVATTLTTVAGIVANAEKDQNGNLTDKGKLTVKAGEIFVENLYGYDHNKLLGASVALAAKSGIKNSPFDNEYSLSFGYKDLKQVVLGTVGEGNVTAASINGDLNRDLNNAEQETGVRLL